jgi:hypothetical protein
MIVLHKAVANAGLGKHVLPVSFHEETARVGKDPRLDDENSRQCGLGDLQIRVPGYCSAGHAICRPDDRVILSAGGLGLPPESKDPYTRLR